MKGKINNAGIRLLNSKLVCFKGGKCVTLRFSFFSGQNHLHLINFLQINIKL